MSEANGVFVHLFRNKEAWKQNEGLLETAKGKFEAEQEYRKKLAVEAGLKEDRVAVNFNNHVDAKLFYPEFDCESPEFEAWLGGKEKNLVDSSKENQEISDRNLGWPTEVMEELSLYQKHRIFDKHCIFSNQDSNSKFVSRLLFGGRGNKRYLIAWWGEKKYYDQIQEKLAELQKSKAEAEAAKLKEEQAKAEKEENPETGKENSKFLSIAKTFVSAIIIGLCAFIIGSIVLGKNSVSRVSEVAIYSNSNRHDGIGETNCSCAVCNLEMADSVYELPVGTVLTKSGDLTPSCAKCAGNFYVVFYEGRHWIRVTKSVFDKLKVGDKIPFKRPEY